MLKIESKIVCFSLKKGVKKTPFFCYSKSVMEKQRKLTRRKRRLRNMLIVLIFMVLVLVAAGFGIILLMQMDQAEDPLLEQEMTIEYFTEEPETEPKFFVDAPEISEQILTVNEWSRPGKKIKELDYIVIHYLGNPRTPAQENHDYFESLKTLQDVSMSANYVVGLEGEIIHCVPDDEVAYASNKMNSYSISIENCHPDDTGVFNQATYDSLVHLTAYLAEKYGIDRDHIIRHFDVTGKDCPKDFVDHPEKWARFKDEVFAYQAECREAYYNNKPETEGGDTELADFLDTAVGIGLGG